MRSGSAHCHVCLSQQRIGSPLIEHPDVLIAMNELSLRKFAGQVRPGGTIFYNQQTLPADFTPPHDACVVCLPATQLADGLGSGKVANVVMLGGLLEETECLCSVTALEVLDAKVRNQTLLELDRKALQAGQRFIDQTAHVGAVSQPDGCGE
jgi:Pyruvate/2-oxoacid:ferredoxin oxidoreductase gamma subunit